MKYLLIGIDGCQKEHFSRFDMPYMQQKLTESKTVVLQEDLISRGWAEICTGLHAMDSGAYYERPIMNGTHDWTTSYNLLEEKKKIPDISTLWELLNSHGYSVGVMNVPTTNPAPEVNGFFVSGGGGGRNVTDEIDMEQCYPEVVKSILDGCGYIVDERLPSLLFQKKLYNEGDFFARLKLMTEKRVESYLALNKQYNVDFGFIVFRSVVVVENIMSSEIDRYLAGDKNINERLINSVKDFYLHLDSNIEKLCVGLGIRKIGFVSDHGTVTQRYSINLNRFLKKKGYQTSANTKTGVMVTLKKYKDILPSSLRNRLKKNKVIARGYANAINYDVRKSESFSGGKGTSFFGIYINDKKRFGGSVSHKAILAKANEIVSAFNADIESKKHGLLAKLQFDCYKGAYDKFWPDILIMVPSGYIINNEQEVFVQIIPQSKQPVYLKEVKTDLWVGTKGEVPLSAFFGHSHLNVNDYNGENLTAVFSIVRKEFGL